MAYDYGLMAAAVVSCLGATGKMALFGYSAGLLLVLLSQAWFFRRFVMASGDAPSEQVPGTALRWKERICSYAWPFSTWGIFAWAQMASDRWALHIFATPQDVGLYAVLYQIGYYPIALLTNLMVQLVSPLLFQRAGDSSSVERMLRVHRINRWLTCVALALTGVVFVASLLFRDLIFRTVVASEYNAAARLLPWVVLAGGLLASGQVVALGPLCATQSKSLLVPKLVTALIGVVLNGVGAAFFGMTGVVMSCVLFSAGYFAWVSAIAVGQYRQLRTANIEDAWPRQERGENAWE